MSDRITHGIRELEFLARLSRTTDRRQFLTWSGVTIAAVATACTDDNNPGTGPAGPVSPGDSTATLPPTVEPGAEVTITVQARDAGGRPLTTGGAEVAATITGANPGGPIAATDNGDGTYTVTYTAANPGTDSIAVTLNGTAISGSPFTVTVGDAVSLGSGDVGVLNYAFALEQLEAAFYTQVVASLYAGATEEETLILTDIRDHEVIHRDFLRAALGTGAIPDLTVDFTGVDFASRDSVLGTARTFEDLGVSAYNGAGQLLESADFLLLAGKIVSVEARHAAAIRDLLNPLSADFAGDDVVEPDTGLDVSRLPAEVLPLADPFLTTTIDASGLPTA